MKEGIEALGEEVRTKSVPSSRSSSKRTRAAEVLNLSGKRRRSRINENMKALQNLIPNSNKTDKAFMLDEAIDYLKQLQLQVQDAGDPESANLLQLDMMEKARRPAFPVQQRLLVSPMLSKGRVNQLFQDWMSRMPQEDEEEEDPTEPAEEEEEVNEVVDPSPAWMVVAFMRMFLRQDRLHRDLDLHWRGGSTSDPGYQGPMDFNSLEQGMIDLSIMNDAGVHPDYGDGVGDHGPME